jgi:hypothetical protein
MDNFSYEPKTDESMINVPKRYIKKMIDENKAKNIFNENLTKEENKELNKYNNNQDCINLRFTYTNKNDETPSHIDSIFFK